ncbi:MAG TPA: tripartite tricarboxylate transporter substrate-binding protein, partial [Ramlibacter sp.]|nr:tripartite tricarboxylate transporter substrate-binding protein [Ramlibacter sp.]
LAAGALLPLAPAAWAQAQAARVVVGFAPGGAADGLARLLADKLRGVSAPSVVVDNKVGAAARIAVDYVRNAPADGTVMALVPDATMFLYPHVYKSLNYDPARDFATVTRMIGMSLAMFIGPGVPDNVKTVADYLVWVKSNPKNLVYGTPAAGATPHFTGAIFARAAGLDMQPVHYKGGAPGIQDLLGGQVPVFFGSVADGAAMVQAGKVRALATSGTRRTTLLPEVPTFQELGYRDLVVEDGLGVYLPAKTPAETVAKLNTAIQAALKTKDLQDPIRNWGFDVSGEGPVEFAARLARERNRWGPIVKATGFTAME